MPAKRGPNTPEGKARSSQNALKHGLLTGASLLYWEDPEELHALETQLRHLYQPAGFDEELLVDRIVVGYWQLRRSFRAETGAMNSYYNTALAGTDSPEYDAAVRLDHACAVMGSNEHLERIQRYGAQIERRLRRAIQDLQCLQAARNHGVPPVYDAVRYSVSFTKEAQPDSEPSRDETAENNVFDQTNSAPEPEATETSNPIGREQASDAPSAPSMDERLRSAISDTTHEVPPVHLPRPSGGQTQPRDVPQPVTT